jgi:hypothetical protein
MRPLRYFRAKNRLFYRLRAESSGKVITASVSFGNKSKGYNMAYDVFLVSALADRDMAKLVARRLRALKFKVWLDQKQTDETFDAKDARDAMNSQSMLVLWSEEAVKSDWVRAAASIGHSRPGMLIQAGLDKTVPYEPFKTDKRYPIGEMTSRKTPEGFYQVVEELGRRDGRTDLREWMMIPKKDEDARSAWLTAHPVDALSLHAKKLRERKLGVKPAPAAEAAPAAALAAASLKGPSSPNGEGSAASGVGSFGAPGSSRAATTTSGASTATTAQASSKAPTSSIVAHVEEDEGISLGTILASLAGIAAMLFLGWAFRTQGAPTATGPILATAAPSTIRTVVDACPVGQVPAVILRDRKASTADAE